MDNIYKAPEAELSSAEWKTTQLHFPVSIRKLWVMSLVTVGLYSIVWNYYHWRTIKHTDELNSDVWPVPRAIFSIFFIYSLYSLFIATCERQNSERSWQLPGMATLYIVATVAGNLLDQLAFGQMNGIMLLVLGAACIIGYTYSMAEGQKVANAANGDPSGSANARFTPANILWMLIGALLWGLSIVGYLAYFFDEI